MGRRKGAVIRTKKYERFRGVDFSTDPALVDDTRSPWAPNIISDMGGTPEKRPGWRVVKSLEGRINGLFSAEFSQRRHLLVHAGTRLYRWEETAGQESILLASGLEDTRSTAVYLGGKLWIFTGGALFCYDGVSCVDARSVAYVPTTVISRDPSGGGKTYEPINLIGERQRVGFLADGTSKVYYLPYANIDGVDTVTVNGTEMQSGFSVNLSAGSVTFDIAPAAPAAGAEDNVFFTFRKSFAGYAERIGKCRTAVVWGVKGGADRIVAAGNPDFPNMDFTCGYADATYWPDVGYQTVGTAQTRIVGYRRLGENLAVVKEDNGQDSTVFIRSGYLGENNEAVFTTKPCLSGAGAVTPFGFGNIGDEQLILTGNGIYALTTNSLTAERVAQNRSYRIDPKLVGEDLSEAVSCNFQNCYLVFAGGHVYGLDGRQPRCYPNRNDTSFLYECFYWENVPARSVLRLTRGLSEELFFGTADGRICKFNTDVAGMNRYNDDGEAIEAIWSTRADDDGDPMVFKTMIKRGNAVTIKPYARSSAKIMFRTDRDSVAWQATEGTMDIFDWEDIDFLRFTFRSNDAPAEIAFRRKVKKYKRLQILIKNDALNEGFGVYAIVKHYVAGGLSKQ